MTLIAYKDGVLCADSLATAGCISNATPVLKTARRADGALFAAAGHACVGQHWKKWFLDGCEGDHPWRQEGDDYDNVAIIHPSGQIQLWASAALPEVMIGETLALGYASYLKGIMDAGKSATGAVKIGCRHYKGGDYPLIEVSHSGDPVIWLSETEHGDPELFYKACGHDGASIIQKRDGPATVLDAVFPSQR